MEHSHSKGSVCHGKVSKVKHIKETKQTYKVKVDGKKYLAAAANKSTWSHQDNASNWQLKPIENSLFNSEVYKCESVWYFNPEWLFQGVKARAYHIYLRHSAKQITSPKLNIFEVTPDGTQYERGQLDPFIENNFNEENADILINTYAGSMDLRTNEGPVTIKMQLFADSQTIENYLIEGAILIPTKDLYNAPPYFLPLSIDSKAQVDWQRKAQQVYLARHENFVAQLFFNATMRTEGHGTVHSGPENLIQPCGKWCITENHVGTVYFDLDEDIKFKFFGIVSGNDCPERDPVKIELLAIHNDSEDYQTVFQVEDVKFSKREQFKFFLVDVFGITSKRLKFRFESEEKTYIYQFQLSEVIFFG
ncbi:UNKNOWN [Stylonychia lemnae]|uniref:F5/8 type C domain-containing protein n=1 Tax=Stylonychia lemnae TaxID=5949 RepID=A0A077ZSF1_STYLE|nr:UNKNOWN [Stylonychia lemnae]|eukprot:CDW72797.1 UNKNOWN [Stylonychia lemnae]